MVVFDEPSSFANSARGHDRTSCCKDRLLQQSERVVVHNKAAGSTRHPITPHPPTIPDQQHHRQELSQDRYRICSLPHNAR
jgi:hypothetical protein